MNNPNNSIKLALEHRNELIKKGYWVSFECHNEPFISIKLEYGIILSNGTYEQAIAIRYYNYDGIEPPFFYTQYTHN